MIKTIHYLKYVIRRLLKVIPMVIGITFLTAFLVHISSDDPATMHFHDAGVPATQQMLDDFRQQHHLDQPFLQQYFIWGKDFIHGDFGVSYQDNQPVLQKIQTAAPYTVNTDCFDTYRYRQCVSKRFTIYESNQWYHSGWYRITKLYCWSCHFIYIYISISCLCGIAKESCNRGDYAEFNNRTCDVISLHQADTKNHRR